MNLIGSEEVNATDIAIPLLNPMNGQPTGDEMPIDNLMAIMYSVYAFARTYQPPVIEEQPNGND